MMTASLDSQADTKQTPIAQPSPPPDGPPDYGRLGGYDNVPYIPVHKSVEPLRAPMITGAGMVNGKVRFTFGGEDTSRLWYIVSWSRPGQAEVFQKRSYHPGKMEEFIIDETPLWNTVYTFRVKGEGKPSLTLVIGDGPNYTRSARDFSPIAEKSFRTPPHKSTVADKAKGNHTSPLFSERVKAVAKPAPPLPPLTTDRVKAATAVTPFSRTVPSPTIGQNVLTKNPN
jgi:hypothetical protein